MTKQLSVVYYFLIIITVELVGANLLITSLLLQFVVQFFLPFCCTQISSDLDKYTVSQAALGNPELCATLQLVH